MTQSGVQLQNNTQNPNILVPIQVNNSNMINTRILLVNFKLQTQGSNQMMNQNMMQQNFQQNKMHFIPNRFTPVQQMQHQRKIGMFSEQNDQQQPIPIVGSNLLV